MAKVTNLPERDGGQRLTVRQRKILEFIRDTVERRGYPPSIREIGDAVGLASVSSVSRGSRPSARNRRAISRVGPTVVSRREPRIAAFVGKCV